MQWVPERKIFLLSEVIFPEFGVTYFLNVYYLFIYYLLLLS